MRGCALDSLDWADIVVHGVLGAGVGILAALSGMWALIPVNALFWLCRELLQHGDPMKPFGGSVQSTAEWIVPALACGVVAAGGWTMR